MRMSIRSLLQSMWILVPVMPVAGKAVLKSCCVCMCSCTINREICSTVNTRNLAKFNVYGKGSPSEMLVSSRTQELIGSTCHVYENLLNRRSTSSLQDDDL